MSSFQNTPASASGISIVIPAFNEEKTLPKTVPHIDLARQRFAQEFQLHSELIVVNNASTDRTVETAQKLGAKVVPHEIRNISSVRNEGIRQAAFNIVVTIDADTFLPPDALVHIWSSMEKGKTVGGCLRLGLKTEKAHLRIIVHVLEALSARLTGISVGVYFFSKEAAIAVGGFPESHLNAEDLVFAWTLRAHGKKMGMKFLNLRSVTALTMDRKHGSVSQMVRALLIGLKAVLGMRLSEKDLSIWYRPDR